MYSTWTYKWLLNLIPGVRPLQSFHVQWYIPLIRQSYFSSEPLSKTGYWLQNVGVCHCWFQLHALTRPMRSANREVQNLNFLPTVGFEPATFRFRSELSMRCATTWWYLSSTSMWPCFTSVCYLKYLFHMVDVAKWFFVFLSYKIYFVLLFD